MDQRPTDDGQAQLEALGYEQQLERNLTVRGVVGLSMANVSPTMVVLLLSTGVFSIGGTFAIGANLLLAIVVMMIALCLAELSALYPIAGGMYSLVRNVMPGPITWISMFNFLIQGIVIPASFALGIPPFLKNLFPGLTLDDRFLALIILLIAASIALTTVKLGALMAGGMVIVEITVLTIVTFVAVTHPHQDFAAITFHPMMLTNGQLTAVTAGTMLATLAPAFNMINGYDGALAFSEEVKGGGKAMARAVVICAALACICIIIPLVAALIAAPDLTDFFSAPNPVIYVVEKALGSKASALIAIGGAVALFNGLLAMLMYFGRAFYATGRDNVWPRFISTQLATVNRFRAPAAGVITIVVPSIALIFLSALNFLLVFSGTIIAAVYFVIGLAAVWSRVANKDIHRPYRMPLWPVPPIIVVLFTGVALATQETIYLLTEVLLIVIALVAWWGSRFWSRGIDVSSNVHLAEAGTDQQK